MNNLLSGVKSWGGATAVVLATIGLVSLLPDPDYSGGVEFGTAQEKVVTPDPAVAEFVAIFLFVTGVHVLWMYARSFHRTG